MGSGTMRVAVAGCGSHATSTVWPCLRHGRFEVAYAYDPELDRAESTRQRFGAARSTAHWDDVLDDASVEAVLVVGEPAMNHAIALESLSRGKHVFAGSAPAATLDQVLELAQAAERANVRCQVGFHKRFALNYLRARDAVAHGAPLCQISCSNLSDMSLHALDLARFFMGDPSEAHVVKRSADHSHRICALTLLYASGGVAVVNLSSNAPGTRESVELSDGTQLISVRNLVEYRITRDGAGAPPHGTQIVTADGWTPPFAVPFQYADASWLQGFAGAVVEFAASILAGRDPTPTLADAVAAMSIVEAILRAPEGMSELELGEAR